VAQVYALAGIYAWSVFVQEVIIQHYSLNVRELEILYSE